jgi:hypothetical protein
MEKINVSNHQNSKILDVQERSACCAAYAMGGMLRK